MSEKIEKFRDSFALFHEKMKRKQSLLHQIFIVFTICFYGIMLFSKPLFEHSKPMESTKIGEIKVLDSLDISMVSREYNSQKNLVQFTFYKGDTSVNEQSDLQVSVDEKKYSNNKFEAKMLEVDSQYFIVLVQHIPSDWEALRIQIGSGTSANDSTISFISSKEDASKNDNLEVKKMKDYQIEVVQIEIDKAENLIAKEDKKIENLKKEISKNEQKVNELEADKKYQTEQEITKTDGEIELLKHDNEDRRKEIETIKSHQEEQRNRIEKLALKQQDLEKE